MADIVLPVLRCHRCGKSWTPRRTVVKMCPNCKSRLFETPRRPSRKTIARLIQRLEGQPPPSFEGCGPVRLDGRRRQEKDEMLVKHGMRPSLSYGSR